MKDSTSFWHYCTNLLFCVCVTVVVLLSFSLKSCSYFTSNAFPLKIRFINANAPSGNINIIFKVSYSSNLHFLLYAEG